MLSFWLRRLRSNEYPDTLERRRIFEDIYRSNAWGDPESVSGPGSNVARASLFRPDLEALELTELLSLSEADFRRRFRGTALTRPRRRGLLRNAALVLGNRGDPAALPALRRALDDPEPLVREAARWALERITGERICSEPTNTNSSEDGSR